MPSDFSPKVLKPALGLAVVGAILMALGTVLRDDRVRLVGATMLGASVAVGGIGWLSRDPQREPYIEPGFQEPDPEVAEHRARDQDD